MFGDALTYLGGPSGPCVYQIRNLVNNKVYVGSTVRPRLRRRDHRRKLGLGIHQSPRLQAAWRKYGGKSFAFEILEVVEAAELLLPAEQRWMDALKSYDHKFGYNLCPVAGRIDGYKHTEAAKAKMKGRKFTDEHRAKLSAARRAYKQSPATNAKRSAANRGRKMSPEAVAKSAAKRRGRKMAQWQREWLSNRVWSPEQRANHLASLKSPEYRAAASRRMKLRWAEVKRTRSLQETRA
jgi:group I intron endonuclease